MTRALLAVAAVSAVVAAVVLSTRGEPQPPAGRPPAEAPTDAERLRRLVEARAAALGRGAVAAGTATPARERLDRRDARRARGIGVRDVRATVLDADLRERRARLRVALTYAVRGIAGRFRSERSVHAVEAPGGWRVRRVAGARRRPPWEVAAFRRVRSEHFVVLVPPRVDPASGGLLAALEAGYARVRGLLPGGRLRPRYLVVVAGTARQAVALTARIRGVASLAALTDTEVREEGRERRVASVASQRLLVVWPAYRAAGRETGATVVAHELTHAVLAPETSGRTPAWLLEGLAMYVSDDRRVGEAAALVASGRAPTLAALDASDAIAALSGRRQADAYAYASAAAVHIARHHGRRRLLRLARAFNDPAVAGTGAAVRRVLGISRRRLERDLRRWLAGRAAAAAFGP